MGVKGTVVVVVALCAVVSHVHSVVTSADDQPLDFMELLTRHGHYSKRRERRAAYANRAVKGFSQDEKRIIVEKHNSLRALEQSSDMMYMYWDKDLEDLAQSWVERCVFEHSSQSKRSDVGPYFYVGENLYASSATYDPGMVIQNWYDEVKFYNYNTGQCSDKKVGCGHYTQVVWAKSHAVGCGVRYCPELQKVSFGRGFFVSCNYGPGGNIVRQTLYKKGKACSACPTDAIYCVKKLCARVPVVEEGSDLASRDQPLLLLIGCCLVSAIFSTRLIL